MADQNSNSNSGSDATGGFPLVDKSVLNEKTREEQEITGENPAVGIILRSKKLADKRLKKYRLLSEKHHERGKIAQSERCLEKAVYISLNTLNSDDFQVAADIEKLATLAYQQGKISSAEALMMRAKRIKSKFES